ncbi:MAG: hypothetical protein GTO62_03190, partial [Planctomycetales bacterium]|nr:hypothetical protein [Planctomycetales bacterium]
QTGGELVDLSATDVAQPTFTTHPIEDFIELDENLGLVGIDALAVAQSTYEFKVTVSDGNFTRVGVATVISGSISPAQPTLPLGV